MNAEQGPRHVAYVMTHYPRVALSFIGNEIDGVERLGMRIHPLAMNLPANEDLLSDEARARRDRTTYLKQSWGAALGALLMLFVRHPIKTASLKMLALRSARADIALMVRRLAHFAQAALAADYCRSHGIRHLHAQFGQAPATVAWFAAEMLNFDKPAEPASWSFTIHGFQDFVDEAVARLDLKAEHAAFVACISDFTRSQLFRVSNPKHWHKAHVVRCGIDLDAFGYRAKAAVGSPPKIVTVGRLSPEKGQAVLLTACAILAERQQPFHLSIVGSGPYEPELCGEIERLGLGDRVRLTGELPADQVRRELEEADIFCLPSFSEGLPVSIMEAMAIGVPVVTTAIAGIPELAVNGETALTVPPANAEALADAIGLLLDDGHLRERLCAAARRKVEEAHDTKANVGAMFELLRAQPALTVGQERLA